MKTAKKTAKKISKKTTTKVATKAVKKVATKVATNTVKKTAKKTVKKTTAIAATKITAITPSGSAQWTLTLSNGTKVKVAAAAAQSVGVRVNGAWSDAVATRLAKSADDQKAFTKAMQLLARSGAMTRATLETKLGSDPRAKRTVAALVANGWVS
jgi:hypothetical protein